MIPRRFMLSGLLWAIVVTTASSNLWAQFTSGIEGTVTDSSGAVIAGATVTIRNEQTGAEEAVQTHDAGSFRFTTLPAAVFTVRATANGFKTTIQEHVQVAVAETQTVNLHMMPGGGESVINVSAEAPLVETAEGRISGEIEESQVHDLPLTGRNFYTLVVLTPGVTGLASGGGQAYAQASGDIFNPEFGVNLSANGARSESNSFLIDSASIDSSQRNGVTNVNPNAEDVQELRVAANNFSAEYGRNSSALVNITTKQGSNKWHGALDFYHTDNKLQAKNEFQSTGVPVFRRNEGTGAFGGPLRKDHTFFFATVDFLKSGVASGRATTVIAPAFLNFLKSDSTFNNNISTFVASSFPASITPTGSIDAGHAAQLVGGSGKPADCAAYGGGNPAAPLAPSPFPVSGASIPCNLPVIQTGNFAISLPRNGFQYTIRLDHSFHENKDRIFGSYNHTNLTQVLFGAPFVYPAFNTLEPTYSMHFALGWVHVTKGGFVNELGFATTRPFGSAKVNHPEVPGISVQGIEGYQTGWGPNEFVQNNFEWRDVASFTHGSHNLKIGGRVTRERADHESSRVYNRPIYSFNSVFDFADDYPTNEGNIGFNPVTGQHLSKLFSLIRTGSLAGFVQDDWKLKPNLTVNAGFRYENFFNPSDAQGNQGICNMTFPNGGSTLQARIANGVMKCQKHLLDHSMNNFSPRLGFAWDPSKEGKMSIRGGFGIFYDRPSNQLYDSGFSNVPRVALANANVFTPFKPVFALGGTTSPPYNYPFPPGLQTGLNAHGGLLNGLANVVVADPNLKTMYMENWFFGVQRSISPTMVAEINYIGSQGHHEYARYNLNRLDGDLIRHGGQFTGLQPGFFDIDFGQSNESSHYNGMTAALRKRAQHGLTLDAAYTYGKAIDQSSKHDAPEHAEAYNDGRERGLADFDIRHRFSFTTLWSIPSPASSGVLNKVFGNWELTNVTILQSGPPFSVICTASYPTCDYNADGTGMDYPNVPSFGSSRSGLSRSDYLTGIFPCNTPNTGSCLNGVFPAPAAGQQGSLGRNTYHGPGYANTDFSVIKNIKTPWFFGSEGADVQFRAEFFNLFNRVNLTNAVGDLANQGSFGKSVSAYPARDIQFGLRIGF